MAGDDPDRPLSKATISGRRMLLEKMQEEANEKQKNAKPEAQCARDVLPTGPR